MLDTRGCSPPASLCQQQGDIPMPVCMQEGFKSYLDEAAVCSDVRVNHMPFLGCAVARGAHECPEP